MVLLTSRMFHTPHHAVMLHNWLWCLWRGTEVFLAVSEGVTSPSFHVVLGPCCSACIDQGGPLRTHHPPPPGVHRTTSLRSWVFVCPWLIGSIDNHCTTPFYHWGQNCRQQQASSQSHKHASSCINRSVSLRRYSSME